MLPVPGSRSTENEEKSTQSLIATQPKHRISYTYLILVLYEQLQRSEGVDGIPGHYLLTLLLNDAAEAGVSADFSVAPGWVEHLSDDTLIIVLNIRRRVLPEMCRACLNRASPQAE